MKFVALVSGGKDSVYSIQECQRNGHELVACVHLGAPEREEEESYMYQTAASEVLPVLVEECLGVPLILYRRVGKSVNTSLVYEKDSEADEVEDLYQALALAVGKFPSVQAVSSGAILSTYQRVRIENVCCRLGLTSMSYLWRMAPQKKLLEQMLEGGIEAVLVKTACPPGLIPQKHLGKTLGQLYYSGLFQRLNDRYQFHICGEGGEFETLVTDCPLYQKKLVLDETEIAETDDGVGVLVVKKCHAEVKIHSETSLTQPTEDPHEISSSVEATSTSLTITPVHPRYTTLPRTKRLRGGLLHVSEITSPIAAISGECGESEDDLAVKEAKSIFSALKTILNRYDATPQDVMFVHLYLSEISHFGNINSHYKDFFGTLLPPSRSCVAVGRQVLPGGRRVLLDCMIQCGSGDYMRSSQSSNAYATAALLNKSAHLRQVLHVQSISNWAPVCVGPYSQANTFRSCLHFLAGQIGLIPSTMKLHSAWIRQLEQCWTNVASVVDALDSGSLHNVLSGVVYVAHEVCAEQGAWEHAELVSSRLISDNGGVVPGQIDATSSELFCGYEDEGTRKELMSQDSSVAVGESIPLLFVSIPEMPVGALVEVEVICATQRASSCLETQSTWKNASKTIDDESTSMDATLWDTGHDFLVSQSSKDTGFNINVGSKSLGKGCASIVLVTASLTRDSVNAEVNVDQALQAMLDTFDSSVLGTSSGFTMQNVLHVRLFYVVSLMVQPTQQSFHVMALDDGMHLRCALQQVLALHSAKASKSTFQNIPATTAVPVERIKMTNGGLQSEEANENVMMAMQILVLDPVQLETDLWINDGRAE